MTFAKQQEACVWEGHLQFAQRGVESARKGMAATRSQPLGLGLVVKARTMSLWLVEETFSQRAKFVPEDARPARRSAAEFSAR